MANEFIASCRRLERRIKKKNPHFAADGFANIIINVGEMLFGYDDADVKLARDSFFKLYPPRKIIYTVYRSKGKYSARKWALVDIPGLSPISDGIIAEFDSLEEVRQLMPAGFFPTTCKDKDDIVENWTQSLVVEDVFSGGCAVLPLWDTSLSNEDIAKLFDKHEEVLLWERGSFKALARIGDKSFLEANVELVDELLSKGARSEQIAKALNERAGKWLAAIGLS